MTDAPINKYLTKEEIEKYLFVTTNLADGTYLVTCNLKYPFTSYMLDKDGNGQTVIFKNQFDVDSFNYGDSEYYKGLTDYQRFTDRKRQLIKEIEENELKG